MRKMLAGLLAGVLLLSGCTAQAAAKMKKQSAYTDTISFSSHIIEIVRNGIRARIINVTPKIMLLLKAGENSSLLAFAFSFAFSLALMFSFSRYSYF